MSPLDQFSTRQSSGKEICIVLISSFNVHPSVHSPSPHPSLQSNCSFCCLIHVHPSALLLCPLCDPFQALKHGYLKKGQISSKGFTTPHLPCRRIGFLQLLFVNLFLVGLGSPGILFFAPPSQSLFEEFPECFSPGLSRPFPSQASQRNDPGLMNFGPGSIIT